MKNSSDRSGFILFEAVVYLFVEVVVMLITAVIIINPLYQYFNRLSYRMLLTECITAGRNYSFYKTVRIDGTNIAMKGSRIVIDNLEYLDGPQSYVCTYSNGNLISRGGAFYIKDNMRYKLINIVPVTGVFTIPK